MRHHVPQVNKSRDYAWVRRAIDELDITPGEAIRLALGGSLPTWAAAKGLNRTEVATSIYSQRRPSKSVVSALADDLNATEEEILDLLWRAMKPDVAASA